MATKKFKFEKFTTETAKATRVGWIDEAEAGLAFVPELERLFDWVDSHQEISDHDAVAFGVFDGENPVALGVCEVTVQRKTARSKWIKMLRLNLRPSIESQLQEGDSDLAMNVFIESMRGSITLQMDHQANTLKVYGRTNEQLNFLRALVKHLQPSLAGKPAKVSVEGRFLSIVTP